MHTLKFPIRTGRRKEKVLAKLFYAMTKCHNVIVKECKKRLRTLRRDKGYKELLEAYRTASEKDKKSIIKAMNSRIAYYGLTEASVQSYIKVWQRQYKHLVSSHQAQEEASRVYAGVERVLYGNGKDVHFRKYQEMLTIASKSWNGVQYLDPLHTGYYKKTVRPVYPQEIYLLGEHFEVKADWDDPYIRKSLENGIRYVQVSREMFPSGWRYHVILYLEGEAPLKHTSTSGTAGIDPGISTEAVVFDDECILAELAPKCRDYNKQISMKASQAERSLRLANPDNYDSDDRLKKGKHAWVITKSCSRRKRELKSLYRKKAAYTKQSHEELANTLVEKADIFLAEAMDWKALQKRSKQPAQRQEKVSSVTGKDGSKKPVRKFKKKKRFGASIRDRAPSGFLSILRRKCRQQGGDLIYVDTRSVRASQYDHVQDRYIKVPLSCRMKEVGGHRVQRDLYSGFIIKHVMEDNKTVDRKACIRDFEAFLKAQDKCIANIKAPGNTYPACFGF